MRVKLSSLQPSQLLPNFKTGQQRLPVPGSVTQQRAIQRSLAPDSDVLGSPSNPIPIPDSPPPNNGYGNKPMSPNGNERISNGYTQQSQLPQASSDVFEIPIPPRNPNQEKMVSDSVFKVPFLPGSNKAPSYGPVSAFSGGMVSPIRQNFQQPLSPQVPILASQAQRLERTSQSELHRPIQDATRSSYNNPSVNPVINREPRPPSPLYPVDFSPSSPDIQIIKDSRPLPPFKSIKSRPPGGTYISVTLPDGSIGYKIDTEGMNPSPYSFSNFPITSNEGLPYNSNFQPLRVPVQVNVPFSSSSSSPRILPKPTLSQPLPLRTQIPPQVNLPQQTQPSVPGDARIRPSGVIIDPAANSKPQSIQGLWSNKQLEGGGPFYTNRQFQMASQQPVMPMQSINSAADAEQSRSRPPQLAMDINRPNIGQTRPYAESSRPQLIPNNMGLRSYLSSPPLSALKTRQQPVRISPATDNINNYRNSLTEKQLIFPQPAAASSALRFNSQNQLSPYGPLSQNAMAQSPQNILPKAPLLQKTNSETVRTPAYFIQQSVPGYSAPQPRSPSPYTSLRGQQPNQIPENHPLLQGSQSERIPTTLPGTQQNKIPTLCTSSQRLQQNRNSETFLPFQESQSEKIPTLRYTSPPGVPPNRLSEAHTTPQRPHPNRLPETYTTPQRPQPNWPSEAYALSQGRQSNRIPEAYSSLQGPQPERIPTPFASLQGTQPNRISDTYPSLQGPQPERIPTPFAALQGNQPNRISNAYLSLQGPQPERIPTPYPSQGPQNKIPTPYLLQDSQSNRIPERSPSARLPSQTPGFTRFPFFQMPRTNSPNLRNETTQNDQYIPNKRGRFVGQSNPSQELYRQPEYAQEYFKRLQSPFQGQFSRNDQVNYQNSNPYQSGFTQQQGRSKTTQKERTKSQIQQMDIQKRFQEIHDAEYRDVGKFQQIPSRGNQAGGQYQQLQSANPPRQLPFQQGFSNPYGIQGPLLLGDAPSRSQQSSPFTPEPFGYRGQHFSYGPSERPG